MTNPSAGNLEAVPITASKVPEAERHLFLPEFYPGLFMAAETLTYVVAKRYISGYCGAYWNFFKLSNGAYFMAPDEPEPVRVVVTDNYTDETMSAEAAGIVTTLYVLGQLMNARLKEGDIERYVDLWHKLRDYACQHNDCAAILKAID